MFQSEARVVVFDFDQDNRSAGLRAKLAAVEDGSVFIDLASVPHVTVGSLGELAALRRRFPAARIVLAGAAPPTLRLLSVSGFDSLFEIAPADQTPVR